jgi:hypothetical protein
MAELFTLKPLFPGSSEIDQIYKICAILGSPKISGDKINKSKRQREEISGGGPWEAGLKLASEMGFKFPAMSGCGLSKFVPRAPDEALVLMSSMLSYDPDLRPTAMQALQTEWFKDLWSTAYGRAAFTPSEAAQALQLLGDEAAEYNPDQVIPKARPSLQKVESTPNRPDSASSFELPYDTLSDSFSPEFYSNVPAPVLSPAHIQALNSNRNPQTRKGTFEIIIDVETTSPSFSTVPKLPTFNVPTSSIQAIPKLSTFGVSAPSSPEHTSNHKNISGKLSGYQAKQWESHIKNIQVQQQTQHTLNQNVHNSITKGSPVFYNPFQKLPGILQPLETQALNSNTDKSNMPNNNSMNNSRKASSKTVLHASPKSLRSSQNLSNSQKSLLEAEAVYNANSHNLHKPDLSSTNIPSPSKPSFLSFFSTGRSKGLTLKGTLIVLRFREKFKESFGCNVTLWKSNPEGDTLKKSSERPVCIE